MQGYLVDDLFDHWTYEVKCIMCEGYNSTIGASSFHSWHGFPNHGLHYGFQIFVLRYIVIWILVRQLYNCNIQLLDYKIAIYAC